MSLSPTSAALIGRVMAARENAGLHLHWQLPDGSQWSAHAKDESQKAAWIAAKAKLGWQHLPSLDNAPSQYSANA